MVFPVVPLWCYTPRVENRSNPVITASPVATMGSERESADQRLVRVLIGGGGRSAPSPDFSF